MRTEPTSRFALVPADQRATFSAQRRRVALAALTAVLALLGCSNELDEGDGVPPIDTGDNIDLQGVYNCSERQDTGYRSGNAFAITVVTVDGRPVERSTGNAYIAMQAAASSAGVSLRIVSGFRTMAEQEYFYGCYVNCNCNNCNLAARPGTSNHQSGHALDLNTSDGGVLNWLNNNGARFGFSRTVPSEAWHWEWWGNAADVPSPCGADARCLNNLDFGGCDGSVVTRCDNNQVGSGDCGFFGATCSTDGGTPHCVHPLCPANLGGDENGSFCRDDSTVIGTCDFGAYSEGDCGAFGAGCSERGEVNQAHCVHPQCLIHLDGGEDGAFCLDDSRIGTCDLGVYGEGDCAAFGGTCSNVGGGHCVHFLCWSNLDGGEDGSFCDEDGNHITCTAGVPVIEDCGSAAGVCACDGATSVCTVPGGATTTDPPPDLTEGEDSGDDGDGGGDSNGEDDEGNADVALDLPSSVIDPGCAAGEAPAAFIGLGWLLLPRRRRA